MTDAPTEILPAAAAPSGAAAPPHAAGSCRACSAPLAADQRYCLSCGARVAAPRVELAGLAGAAVPAQADGGGRHGGRWALMLDRVGGPMGAAAVVLVALGVGFLLGQGSGSGSGGPATIIQRPPVVNVQGGGTVAPSDTSAAGADTSGGGAKGGGRSAAPSTKGVPQADTSDDAGGDLNRLRAQPEDQATGGTAPRTDNKASGGGTEAETIG